MSQSGACRSRLAAACGAAALCASLSMAANQYPAGYQGLMPLPENPHYFQWEGLPFFMVRGGGTNDWNYININGVSNGNDTRFFCDEAAHGGTSSLSPLEAVKSDKQYQAMATEAKRALEQDRIYSITFFHKNWCAGTTSDELIKRAIKYTWQYPNVCYSFMYEGPTSESWVQRFKDLGKQADASVVHMFFSIQNGEPAKNIDLLFGQGASSGIQWGFPSTVSASYYDSHRYPLVRHAVVQCLCPGKKPDGSNTCFNVGENGCVAASWDSESGRIMRKQVLMGVHSGTPYGRGSMDNSYMNNSLQIRWYVENMKSFGNEPGDELTDAKLPRYVKSARPTLSNPTGYTNGAKATNGGADFAVVYKDIDGDAPAQAEVWVDLDDDGRFDPDPSAGERLAMEPSGSDYAAGVTYRRAGVKPGNTGTRELRYVFRFADRNWYPPSGGGLMKSAGTAAYGYGHWTVDAVENSSTAESTGRTSMNGTRPGVTTDRDGKIVADWAVVPGHEPPSLTVYDPRGVTVGTVNAQKRAATDSYRAEWQGLPPGMYVAVLRHGPRDTERRLVCVKRHTCH